MSISAKTNSTRVRTAHCEIVASMQGVSRYFDNPHYTAVLNNVSFSIYRGEVFGLLGPEGAGKSTTLRILAGRLSPSAGRARVFGRPPRRRSARQRVGYLPESGSRNRSGLFARAVGLLRDLLIWRQGPPRAQMVDMMAGNKRVSFLKLAAFKKPDLLLLDEPFKGMNLAESAEISDLIVALAQRGKTILLTCNSLTYAKDICDRIAIIYAGKIETVGTLDEILATTAAIRFIAPVLPQGTAQRVLNVLRENLSRPVSAAESPIPRKPADSTIVAQSPVALPATVATTPDEFLAPLVSPPSSASSQEERDSIALPVDHKKLASLTQPDSTAPPHEPEIAG